MIPNAFITAHRQFVPWVQDYQVEQDLIICRALKDIFSDAFLSDKLAFRGGTALHKLYFSPPLRYSEDIDLVQVQAGPIGDVLSGIRKILDPVLGTPKRNLTSRSAKLYYRVESEGPPAVPLRLKVEINTREHIAYCGYSSHAFNPRSRWCSGECEIKSFCLDELLATKMRALYQRKKGRDLFDLWAGISNDANTDRVVETFGKYMMAEGSGISSKVFQDNLDAKMKDKGFLSDMNPLISAAIRYDVAEAYSLISEMLIARLDKN